VEYQDLPTSFSLERNRKFKHAGKKRLSATEADNFFSKELARAISAIYRPRATQLLMKTI